LHYCILQYYHHMPEAMSTNSYAVLGMLALRSWTPYELTQQFLRSLAWCWPVSERSLYTEPEKLVAAGLAKVRTTGAAHRARREYSITEAGKKALREWLGTPTSPPRIFNEPLLRVLYADQGTKENLLQALASLRDGLVPQFEEGLTRTREYLDGTGPFPERAHLVALFADLGQRLTTAIDEWAADTAREVSTWHDTKDLGMTPSAKRTFRRVAKNAHPA
jgi:DNA-binding PadR family transcriptional regulator